MWWGVVSIILGLHNIEDLQRIYCHIIPLLKNVWKIQLSEQVVELEYCLFVFGI